jgi:hypothetical protein
LRQRERIREQRLAGQQTAELDELAAKRAALAALPRRFAGSHKKYSLTSIIVGLTRRTDDRAQILAALTGRRLAQEEIPRLIVGKVLSAAPDRNRVFVSASAAPGACFGFSRRGDFLPP